MKNIKVSVNIAEPLLKQIDDKAEKMCMSRTNIILLALNKYFEQENAMEFLKSKKMEDMLNLMIDFQNLDK